MKCSYHPSEDASVTCSACKRPLCRICATGGGTELVMCSQCMALKAAHEVAQGIDLRHEEKENKAQMEAAKRRRRSRRKPAFQLGLLVVALSVITIQSPELAANFADEKPVRVGTYDTDAKTDQCIKDLWHISKMLQEEKLPNKGMICPASKNPYVVIKTDADVVVQAPNPQLYGFREIRVSKSKPIPELIK